jgi:hypothetical protein
MQENTIPRRKMMVWSGMRGPNAEIWSCHDRTRARAVSAVERWME